MPDISKINNVAVADISKLDSITFADGQKVNNQDVSLITDAHTLITTITVPEDSSSPVAAIDFTSGIDSTYDVYEFVATSLHPASSGVNLLFQVNLSNDEDGDYDQTRMSSTHWQSYHNEANTSAAVAYSGNYHADDVGTGIVKLLGGLVNGNDNTASGTLQLYGPSSTSFNSHALSRFNFTNSDPHYTTDANVTILIGDHTDNYSWVAVTQVRFMMSSGNIDAGEIKMYGYKIT